MGKLNSSKRYLYIANGAGLSPNINGLRFYDSGLIYNGKKSFYSEDGQYAIWFWSGSPTAIWLIGTIANIGTFTVNCWGKAGATDTVAGSYIAAGDKVGTVIISEYKNKISIKKQNLGGGDLLLSREKIQSPDEISDLILWTSKNTSFSIEASQTRLSRISFAPDDGTWPENIPQNYYRYDLNSEIFYGDFDENYYVFYSSIQGLWFINDDYVGSDIAGAENILGSSWYSYGNEFSENGVSTIYIYDWDVNPWTSYGNDDAQWTWPGLKSNNNFVTRFSPRSSIQSVSQFGAPDFIKDINNYPFKATTTLDYTNPFSLYIVLRDYQGQDVGDSNICGNERAYINYIKTAGAGATFYLKYSYTQIVNLFNVNKTNFINAPAILKIVNENFSGSTKRITVSFISTFETKSYTGLWTPSPLYGLGLGGIDFYLGNKNLGSTNTFNGAFYDVVLYNRNLSSNEDTKVLRYLRERNL